MVANKKRPNEEIEEEVGGGLYGVAMAAMARNLKEKKATRRHLERFNEHVNSFSANSLQLELPLPKRK